MIIYYHNDLDGRCAAAIAYRRVVLPSWMIQPKRIDLIEVDYKDNIILSEIEPNEQIIIVDFSFRPEVMNVVLTITQDVTWLDHHKTALEYKYDFPEELFGTRDVNFSGCELAWRYFKGNEPIPRAVALIGDYDKWALKYQPECFEFYEGLRMEDTHPRGELWTILFSGNALKSLTKVNDITHNGRIAIRYRDSYCSNLIKQVGYETRIKDWPFLTAFAANMYYFGSKGFGDLSHHYDFVIAYVHDGRQFQVSLYSEKVDVSEIAKHYGGGGHSGAAGFVCNELPFKKEGSDEVP